MWVAGSGLLDGHTSGQLSLIFIDYIDLRCLHGIRSRSVPGLEVLQTDFVSIPSIWI